MSSLLAVAKFAAIAAALLCLSSIGPGILLAGVEQPAVKATASAVPAVTLRCRMYFGCVPVER